MPTRNRLFVRKSIPIRTAAANPNLFLGTLECAIDLSIRGQQIDQIKEESFYTLTNCKLRFYYGKCLSTTRITDANSLNISSVPLRSQSENWICCPQILNVAFNSYQVCNNKDCSKKITSNPAGAQIVRCISCNRSSSLMLCSAICKKK